MKVAYASQDKIEKWFRSGRLFKIYKNIDSVPPKFMDRQKRLQEILSALTDRADFIKINRNLWASENVNISLFKVDLLKSTIDSFMPLLRRDFPEYNISIEISEAEVYGRIEMSLRGIVVDNCLKELFEKHVLEPGKIPPL